MKNTLTLKVVLCVVGGLLLPFLPHAQQSISVTSPNRFVALTTTLATNSTIQYRVSYKNNTFIEPSSLGFSLSRPKLTLSQFTIVSVDSSTTDETWQPVWGEVNRIRNHYKALSLLLKDKSGVLVKVHFRVFNEGVGFRYEFPKQENLTHFVVADELTQFNLAGDYKAFWIPGDYDTNEYLYNTTKLSEVNAVAAAAKETDIALKSVIGPNAVQTPLMLKTPQGLYINLHEAALVNYPVMHLMLDKKTFTLTSHLVPDAVGNKAYLQTPFQTPWRTINVSDKATDILASKLILNLNEPSKITDVSWIKPQKFIGMWWEMHVGKATWEKASGKHGANTANVKTYIDFAAKHGFDGVLVEGWNEGWEDWFGNWKENVFDFITPYPDYNLEELTAYARQKGVRIIMHHETSGSATNYERWMDKAYKYMNDHQINTVKTGYVGKIIPRGEHHDGQWMVNHYQRVAEKAAEYKIMVEAHEPAHPTGLHRTYPNWLANEAARGNEFNNAPKLGLVPEHETILPFTRLMGGPMDYTPGFFHFQLNQYDATRTTRVKTTLAKQLALYVTMYSPLQMAGDFPENFNKHLDAFQFIKDVPVDWDDTQILEAEPGDYITIARREKGKPNWFLGAISDENSRTTALPLNFLEEGATYQATIYRDAENADWQTNPAAYSIEKMTVTNKTTLNLRLAKGGGCAISFRKM
ncbi:glycoside hydrolase family 97 protein [Runella salmonicolor]|uniref:Glycoside hydrolase family 97 protein n=1 Tax=Runella salmonicolor TaxID=2950278 RepID=A0ABT1FQL4_9BACT|nr:glycoside hydrolase family 97 protein [Runella salmonicolor]MCP1383981.1 glycoside hydrolase family 97 protein [Runella salmonicolor]